MNNPGSSDSENGSENNNNNIDNFNSDNNMYPDELNRLSTIHEEMETDIDSPLKRSLISSLTNSIKLKQSQEITPRNVSGS